MNATVVWEFALGLVRHLLTFGGGWLVTSGIATQSEIDSGIGFVMSIAGLAWSWFRKWKRGKNA